LEGYDTWDVGKVTWGGRAKVFGTVPVCVGVQEKAYGGEGVLAGKGVKGALWGLLGFRILALMVLQFQSLW
nr:hypothetical protein [Tanacetum cinerariifolium]